MVLENGFASIESDSLQDGAPSSDSDPYSSTNYGTQNISQTYNIDLSKFPRPLPIIGPLAGYTDGLITKALTQKIAASSQILHRALTQEEVDAFGFWTAKQVSIMSYGWPLGVGGGLWRCYTTADTFRMPFYKPNLEKFDPNVFPMAKLPLLRNRLAVLAWHASRAFFYGGTGNIIGQLFFGSYSMTVATVGELGDKRLKPFIDATKAMAAKKRGALPGTSGQPGVGQQQGVGMQGKQQDSASPGSIPSGEQSPETSWGSMGESAQTEAQPTQRPRFRPTPAQAPLEQTSAQPSDQPFGIFDDASPTGGQGIQADIGAAPAASQGGSSWDRLRRGGQSPKQASSPSGGAQPVSDGNSWSRVRQQVSATNDGYSYNKTEGEDLSKSEVQKDFDARVERERNGGDFVKGNGDQKRW
ncbi:uncharacterized protein RSE6_03039 [Rhynchosporium secalis]|uniref:Endo-1,3(4)-beta-glucanase n=1 Tax=Rhynchosporium secalis TaxID=38038 RepID=A0A1E1M1R8_RHYSE|nr:uncharacterized protein RSE6_03039 [Rhynchosporium secalis]